MAKIKKESQSNYQKRGEIPKKIKPETAWLENKIARTRSFLKPQASRTVARFGAPAGVALLLFLGLYPLLSPTSFEKAKNEVLKNPKNIQAHLSLAEEFLKNNQIDKAEEELLTTTQLDSQESNQLGVLGISSGLEELWSKWRSQNPKEAEKEVQKWEQFLETTPTYRDGWVYLSFYYFKLGQEEKAKESLQKARNIDPLNNSIEKLEENF